MYYQQDGFENYDYAERQNQKVLREINKALNDEFKAIHYYTRLAELAPNSQFKKAILGIRQDEIKHFGWFSTAYFKLSGKYPTLVLGAELPSTFKSGIRASIKDEQETVPFYQALSSQISDVQTKQRVLRAAGDEHRHAQIFNQINTSL
ncbi:MAG: ferritin-like domain-containing protein [Bacillota bacterium]|nr:ferritin-like domain-containing protein [Bacillota bacterium]